MSKSFSIRSKHDLAMMPDGPIKQQLTAAWEAEHGGKPTPVTAKPTQPAPAINVGEELFWQQLADAKIQGGFEKQFKFDPNRGFEADFGHKKAKLLVEIDGGIYTGQAHGSITGILKGMERSNHAAMHGYRMLRFTPDQVTKEVTAIEMVKDFLARHGSKGAALNLDYLSPTEIILAGVRYLTLAEWSNRTGFYTDQSSARRACRQGNIPGARMVNLGGRVGTTWVVPEHTAHPDTELRTEEGLVM